MGFSTSLEVYVKKKSQSQMAMIIPLDAEFPVRDVLLVDLRDCSMVSYVEKFRASKKSLIEQGG